MRKTSQPNQERRQLYQLWEGRTYFSNLFLANRFVLAACLNYLEPEDFLGH